MIAVSLAIALLCITASCKDVVVTFGDSPIWTVGIGVAYADMSITLGESLAFASYSSHDVVLLGAPGSGTHWDQCGQNGVAGNVTSIWAAADFTGASITTKHYTPPTCGDFYITCSVPPHCMYGQRIKVTVKNVGNALCASPCVSSACATTTSKSSASIVHHVKPIGNSGFWGQGPYQSLTVEIGDSVIFRTGAAFHDVATVPSIADFNNCDMKGKTVVADWPYMKTTPTSLCNSSSACCPGTTCGVSGMYVTYTFAATTAGDTYFVCSYGNGNHCKTGQKFGLTVKAPGVSSHAGQNVMHFFLTILVPVAFLVQSLVQ